MESIGRFCSRNLRIFSQTSLAVAALLMMGTPVSSQIVMSAISGVVSDPSGAVVPGVQVVIRNQETNAVVWQGVTDDHGRYQAPELPMGLYELTFSKPGFKNSQIHGVTLQVSQHAAVNAELQMGATTESVRVFGGSFGRLETTTSSRGLTLTPTEISNLPLPSLNPLNLLMLAGGESDGGSATGINDNQLSINGSRTLNNEFTVDGISIVSGSTGGNNPRPPVEAIQEFKVLTSDYSSEYGRTSGATVNMMVKSGANQFHGELYEYFRNEDLNANNFFNNLNHIKRPEDRFNEFGVNIGGPVILPHYNGHDRTFFFFNYDGLRRISPFANFSTIPNQPMRTGDFSVSPTRVIDPTTENQFVASPSQNAACSPSTPTYNPATGFCSNIIPSSRIDSAAAKIMALLPPPSPNVTGVLDTKDNLLTRNFLEAGSSHPGNNQYTARVDQDFGPTTRMFGSVYWYHSTSPLQSNIPGPLDSAVGASNDTGTQIALYLNHTLTPNLIMELNGGFNRDNPLIQPPSLGLNVQSTYGIANSVGNASPVFNISAWSGLGINSNTERIQINNNYQFAGAMSWVHGGHMVKFGAQLRKNEFNVYNPDGRFTGVYTFDGSITSVGNSGGDPVNSLADFLLGDIKTSEYTLPQPITGRRNYNLGFYIQDDWKVSRRLTLNLGLRDEYESPMTVSNNIYSRVDPVTGQLLVAGKNASDSLNVSTPHVNLAPRIGFAYEWNRKTVIRSGYGIFFSQIFSNLGAEELYPGFTTTQQFNNLGTGVPQPFSLSQGMPLIAVSTLSDPLAAAASATDKNPLVVSDPEFGDVSHLSYAQEWNFGVQRQLPASVLLDISYVGSHGVHLPLSWGVNQPPYSDGVQLANINNSMATQDARPFPTVGSVPAVFNVGSSTYNSLQLSATRRFTSRLAFQATYTYSKSLDDGSNLYSFSAPEGHTDNQFPGLFRYLDHGPSEFDRPHSFAGAAVIETGTGGPGWLRWLRNLQISPFIIARSGLPKNVTQNNLFVGNLSNERPNLVNSSNPGDYALQQASVGNAIEYLLPANSPNFPYAPNGPLFTGTGSNRRLALPWTGPGTLGRNTVRTPGEFDTDLALARVFPISERFRLAIRAEAYNLFNQVELDGPNTTLSVQANSAGQAIFNSPDFGLITGARSARFMQIVAKLTF